MGNNSQDVVDHQQISRPKSIHHTTTNRFDAARKNPVTPSPDYDLSDSPNSVNGSTLNGLNGITHKPTTSTTNGSTSQAPNSRKGTMGRCAAQEIAKANGDSAELASIDSYKMTNPASPEPKPPSMYFNLQSTGPATLKKQTRSVSVTIGEYAGRKEMPKQFDFIGKGEESGNGGDSSEVDVNGRLNNELKSTLRRSNLRARNDNNEVNFLNNISFGFLLIFNFQTSKDSQIVFKPNTRSISLGASSPIYPPPNLFKDINGVPPPKHHKPQTNVEKITAMLVSQNLMGSRPGPTTNGHTNSTPTANPSHQQTAKSTTTSTTSSSNRVTININQTNGTSSSSSHRQKDTSGPINGILKNGNSVTSSSSHSSTVTTPNGEPRNISFGNM